MTSTVLWMRHGTCGDGLHRPGAHARPDSPLTLQGAAEVEAVARRLLDRRLKPTIVVPSPLRRAHDSAAVVADTLDARLTRADAVFAEWQAPRCVLGRTPGQYPPAYRAWRRQRTHNPESALPGGESLRAFADRARRAVARADEFASHHGPVVVLSHRLLIGAVAALHQGHHSPGDIFYHAAELHVGYAQVWTLSGPSESAQSSDRRGWIVV